MQFSTFVEVETVFGGDTGGRGEISKGGRRIGAIFGDARGDDGFSNTLNCERGLRFRVSLYASFLPECLYYMLFIYVCF